MLPQQAVRSALVHVRDAGRQSVLKLIAPRPMTRSPPAKDLPTTMPNDPSLQLVVFSLGEDEYALPVTHVQEIIRSTEPRGVASRTPAGEGRHQPAPTPAAAKSTRRSGKSAKASDELAGQAA